MCISVRAESTQGFQLSFTSPEILKNQFTHSSANRPFLIICGCHGYGLMISAWGVEPHCHAHQTLWRCMAPIMKFTTVIAGIYKQPQWSIDDVLHYWFDWMIFDVIEAHCYIVNIGQTVLYAVDKGLRGRNVLHQLLLILYLYFCMYLLTISLPNGWSSSVAMLLDLS